MAYNWIDRDHGLNFELPLDLQCLKYTCFSTINMSGVQDVMKFA